jgi:hypothetical protein
MTELEAATIAFQQASLAAQRTGNDIALWATYMQAGAAVLVGLLQVGIVAWGIRKMSQEGLRREQQHADRHVETMEVLRQQGGALEALIERTAPPVQARP